jgi:hypothetical protein
MSQAEARAWWEEVEHLREPFEQRRAERTVADPGSARRSVTIRGNPVPGATLKQLHVVETQQSYVARAERRRPARRPMDVVGARPDRLAAWAVVATFVVVVVAALTAHA